VSDADQYDEQAQITLMTLHAAKGLEFRWWFWRDWKKDCSRIRGPCWSRIRSKKNGGCAMSG